MCKLPKFIYIYDIYMKLYNQEDRRITRHYSQTPPSRINHLNSAEQVPIDTSETTPIHFERL